MMTYEDVQIENEKLKVKVFILEHPGYGQALLDHCKGDMEKAIEYSEYYQGKYSSLGEYAEELHDDMTKDDPTEHEELKKLMVKASDGSVDWQGVGEDYKKTGVIFMIKAEGQPRDIEFFHVFLEHFNWI